MARPIRLPPPVTSAAPDRGVGSVNPAELEEVDDGQNGHETENDIEGQHGVAPSNAGLSQSRRGVQGGQQTQVANAYLWLKSNYP